MTDEKIGGKKSSSNSFLWRFEGGCSSALARAARLMKLDSALFTTLLGKSSSSVKGAFLRASWSSELRQLQGFKRVSE